MWCLLRKISARKPEDGFTVLELTATVAIFTIVLASLLGVFMSVQRSQAYVTDRSESMDALRLAMNRLSKEVRQATAVTTTTATSFAMRTYIAGSPEDITWSVSGGTLTRSDAWGSSIPVLRNVTNADIFTYTPATGRPIIVKVRLEMRPDQSPDVLLELSSEIRLRNRA